MCQIQSMTDLNLKLYQNFSVTLSNACIFYFLNGWSTSYSETFPSFQMIDLIMDAFDESIADKPIEKNVDRYNYNVSNSKCYKVYSGS